MPKDKSLEHDRLLTEQEAAERLRFSVRHMRNMRARGDISYVALGPRLIRYREQDLQDFIDRFRVSASEWR